jgi:hypothetical protein
MDKLAENRSLLYYIGSCRLYWNRELPIHRVCCAHASDDRKEYFEIKTTELLFYCETVQQSRILIIELIVFCC